MPRPPGDHPAGQTWFTRIPCLPHSMAATFVRPPMASFAIAYPSRPGAPRTPIPEPKLITTPWPDARSGSKQACIICRLPSGPVRNDSSTSWSVASTVGLRMAAFPPWALLTRMSMRPNAARVAATAASTSARSATSQRRASARAPFPDSSRAAAATLDSVRPSRATGAPSSASASAMARPRPWPAPVTTATRPASRPRCPAGSGRPVTIARRSRRRAAADRSRPGRWR